MGDTGFDRYGLIVNQVRRGFNSLRNPKFVKGNSKSLLAKADKAVSELLNEVFGFAEVGLAA